MVKAHRYDDIRMLNICDSKTVRPLSLILKNCIRCETFPNIWKKSILVPVHIKGDKKIIKHYRPVSLLPICERILERLIFNPVFECLDEGKLLSRNQSGFWPLHSCEYELLSVVHSIYKDFLYNPSLKVRANFLDNSKAFDKILHEGLLYKLETVGIPGGLVNLFQSFLINQHQKVVLNGQESIWSLVKAGFLAKFFPDDTLLFSTVSNSPYKQVFWTMEWQKCLKGL